MITMLSLVQRQNMSVKNQNQLLFFHQKHMMKVKKVVPRAVSHTEIYEYGVWK